MNSDVTSKQYVEICPTCDERFYYSDDDIWFDEYGFGYSVKLTKCPRCGAVRSIKYYEDNLDINNDERFYNYSRIY